MRRELLVLDGDELMYKAAFASQHKEHFIKFTEDNIQGPFKTKKDCIEWLGDGEAEEIYSVVVPETEDKARFNAHRVVKQALSDVRPYEHRIYLTGDGNFRFDVATLLPYKGNRSAADKPVHLALVREILINSFKAITVDGMEADDAMSITSWQHQIKQTSWDVRIGTQDKDLRMVPGLHYHPTKREMYEMTWQEGRLSFYKQLLIGDQATDNIPGIYRMGAATASKVLDPLINGSSEELYMAVLAQYKKAEQNPKVASHMPDGKWGEERITEVARLLWMLQEKGQMWSPEEDYYASCQN